MKFYDETLKQCLALLPQNGRELSMSKRDWEDVGGYDVVFKKDMAYELGGGEHHAVSGIGVTSSEELVPADAVWLFGKDLNQLDKDASYARITIARVSADKLIDDQKTYEIVRKIERTRYHVAPKGYMARISAEAAREPVRVSKTALKDGLSFADIGKSFVTAYKQHDAVEAVRVIFVTAPEVDYTALAALARKMDDITLAFDHIFKNIKMDCTSCNLKPVCDTVEGLRELHFSHEK